MPKNSFSRRAEVLGRVLDCINLGQYKEHDGYMIFGGTDGDMLVVPNVNHPDEFCIEHLVPDPEERKTFNEGMAFLARCTARVKRDKGRQEAHNRTSLGEREEATGGSTLEVFRAELGKLSPQARADLQQAFKHASEDPDQSPESITADDSRELLDLYYSYEVLEKVVRRVALLDSLEPAIPIQRVEQYFQEAHRCFLYGFHIATAVLCRALLDAQLRDVLDADGRIEKEIGGSPPPKSSYLKVLINRAADEGLLEDTRELWNKKRSHHWAEEIIDAGNWAIHDLSTFNEKYGGDSGSNKVSELLAITRKALVQLLTKKEP